MFNRTVEVNMVRYIAAILDYIAADILKVQVFVCIYVHVLHMCMYVHSIHYQEQLKISLSCSSWYQNFEHVTYLIVCGAVM